MGQCILNRDPPFCMDSYIIIRSTSDHNPIPAVLAVHAFIPKNCVCGCAQGSLQDALRLDLEGGTYRKNYFISVVPLS